MVEPGLVVRSSDHQTTRLVKGFLKGYLQSKLRRMASNRRELRAGNHFTWSANVPKMFGYKWQILKILANNQLEALFRVVIYLISLHVSNITVLIIRRSNCINTSYGMISLVGQEGNPARHTKQSLTQTNHTR